MDGLMGGGLCQWVGREVERRGTDPVTSRWLSYKLRGMEPHCTSSAARKAQGEGSWCAADRDAGERQEEEEVKEEEEEEEEASFAASDP